jgi:hypothetical protein
LCEFFPFEARFYIEHREGAFNHFLSYCEKFQAFDCCVIIYDRLNDLDRVCLYFDRYIQTQLIEYADDNPAADIGAAEFFIVSFTRQFLRKRGSTHDRVRFAETVVKSFSLPFYCLEKTNCGPEKRQPMIELLKNVSSAVAHAISFPRYLELIVVECQELPVGFVRSSLLSIMNDYEYDLDQNLSMVFLYHEDEQDTHAKYIGDVIRGTRYGRLNCDACGGGLFGMSCGVKLFACGHVFHNTVKCLATGTCPKCNPEERLDQTTQTAIHVVPQTKVRRDLQKFEYLIATQEDRDSAARRPTRGAVKMRPTGAFPS